MELLKKLFPRIAPVIAGVVIGMALSLALFAATGGTLYEDTLGLSFKSVGRASDSSDAELVDLAYEILGYIKESDFSELAQATHPDYGIVFSPYANVTLASNKCFTAEQIAAFASDKNIYVWGVYDGSGDPIEMTPAEYFARFVFDKDYTKSSVIGVDNVVRSGNALENFSEAFPNARFVDFHIRSTEKDAEDLGWGSLRLGFEELRGQWRLTVILHSEWTV